MKQESNYLYRYRSLDKIFEYKELENLEIYFSKPEQLNDHMESYMNIIWQGDEIAFQSLFKHYLYVLTSLFYDAKIRKPKEKINIEYLPVFISNIIFDAPEIQTTFKAIYYEFFSSEEVANIPIQLAKSKKKYTTDEILWILKTLHKYAFFVIDSQIKKYDLKIDVLEDKEYKKTYESIKYSNMSSFAIKELLKEKYDPEIILCHISRLDIETKRIQEFLNQKHSDKDISNLNILLFEFPELYIKHIKKLLFNNFCVASFSETYKNEPMWAHYANNENGICLKFKIQDIDNEKYLDLYSLNDSEQNSSKTYNKKFYKRKFFKVKYSNNYTEIDFFTTLGCCTQKIINEFWLANYDQTKFSECSRAYFPREVWLENYLRQSEEYICTKSTNWKYEQEYRIIQNKALYPAYENIENRKTNYHFENLDAIIFGRKVSSDNKKAIYSIIQKHCNKINRNDFKFYDIYYSTITKQLELKPCQDIICDNKIVHAQIL